MDDSTVDGRARATATSSTPRVYCTDACNVAGLAYTYGTYAHIYAYQGTN